MKKKDTKKINALPRIGIPNKGVWTEKPLRFVVSGNPYISLQRKNQIEKDWGWRKENEKKDLLTYLDEIIEKQVTDYDVALDWDTKNHTIEIVVRLFAENKAQFEIDDAEGIVSQEPIIEFEDGVLLLILRNLFLMNAII